MSDPGALAHVPSSDPATVAADYPLTPDEVEYADKARAANTMRGYQSDWNEFTTWCVAHGFATMPARPAAVSQYLTDLARHGAKVGTMSRRLSAIRFAHTLRNLPSPTDHARVTVVWDGIRRTHNAPPEQSAALMPPELFDVIDACPTEKTWKTKNRPPEPDLAGLRNRALILVGFVGALRRSELAALTVEHINDHPNGLVISLPRSKTNQSGDHHELIILPRGNGDPTRSPVAALHAWLAAAHIDTGLVFRAVSKGNRVLDRGLHPGSINTLIQHAVTNADLENPEAYSAHSLRAGFVTYAHLRGASDRAIAHQTRHRSLATIGGYIRIHEAWADNAATQIGL